MTDRLPRYRVRFVHLTALWAFGVSQPAFAIVDGNPDLLLTRDATRLSVVLFATLLAIVPPALVLGYAWLASRFSRWIGDMVYLFALCAFLVPVAARAVKLVDFGFLLAIVLVAALVAACTAVYLRFRAARLFVGYAIVLPIVSLAVFVQGLPPLEDDAEAAALPVASPTPIVFVQLDELSASALMTRSGEIDAVRYPNFARLAREGTWYRNATTVHEWTADAVPSILSGKIGTISIPLLRNHPDNLFTLLGGSYSLHVHEAVTRLCPKANCPREQKSALKTSYGLLTDSLNLLVPRIFPESLSERMIQINSDISMPNGPSSKTLMAYKTMLGEISRSSSDNVLFFTHQELPHAPWRFFPDGTEYEWRHLDGWYPAEYWADDPWLVLQGFQRHLLQDGYVDSLIGRLLRTLDREGLYERSMIVVVADHGVSFRAGEGRRPLSGDNLADITNIPLFIKYPNQKRGNTESRLVRSVDIMPTIADVLGIRLPWKVDGVSLLGSIPKQRDIVVGLRDGSLQHASLAEMVRDRESTLRHQYEEFGEGEDSVFRIGTNKWLLGRKVEAEQRSSSVRVTIEKPEELSAVRRSSGYLPARISGHVVDGQIETETELAVAVNGRVQALTRCFWDEGVRRFRALVPEASFREGANEVEVFLIRGQGAGASLVSIGSTRGHSQTEG